MPTKKPAPKIDPATMKRVNHFMPQAMIDGLNTVAKREGVVASEVLRTAVRMHLGRRGIKA